MRCRVPVPGTALLLALLALLRAPGDAGAVVRSGDHPSASSADTADVAVAANFLLAHTELARRFQERTGHVVRTSVGSTGQLYAQIVNGAPFDLFLAADSVRPRRLEEAGLAVPHGRFAYAVGRLALFAPGLRETDDGPLDRAEAEVLLRSDAWEVLALANPRIAPYGAAARETLVSLGLLEHTEARSVLGQSIAQTFQFVMSGAADLGFVALSQVVAEPPSRVWTVPEALHAPLVQEAVLLRRGGASEAARGYLDFLRSREAAGVLAEHGYGAAG